MRLAARLGSGLAAFAVVAGCSSAGWAADPYVDLELVLAVDISRSMDYDELKLQREGYVAALKHPEVLAAIGSGPNGRIAVTYVEWSGPFYQATVVPWAILSSAAEAEAFSDAIASKPIMREVGTSISSGLAFSLKQFHTSGVQGLRRVIDVSGDGPNNAGPPVEVVREEIVGEGVTINGLPVMLKPPRTIGPYNIPDLDIYYEDCVIGGPGAFMITVEDVDRFEIAIRRKLVLEIVGLPPRVIPAAVVRPPPRIDCLIGEKLRGRWLFDRQP